MFNWFKRSNRKDKRWQEWREWFQAAEEAKQFTLMKCHWCYTPAHNPEANFCSNCGASFHTENAQQHQDTEPGLYTTEPLQWAGGERPMHAYRRQLQQKQEISEQETQQVQAARPVGIKRTVRIPRLERLA